MFTFTTFLTVVFILVAILLVLGIAALLKYLLTKR